MVARLLLVLGALLIVQPLHAQTAGLPDVTLTAEEVETVITAFPRMRDRLETMDAELESSAEADDIASQLQALALYGTAQSALNAAAAEVGFDDFMDWLATTNAVFVAHAFAQNPEMNAEMQQAIESIESQSALSDAQKEQMKAAIMQSMSTLETMRPPEENLAAVRPYHDEIEAMLEE